MTRSGKLKRIFGEGLTAGKAGERAAEHGMPAPSPHSYLVV